MRWPSAQDYNEAVQHPQTCFTDPGLRNGQPELNLLGLPKPRTGSFATVYRLSCPGSDWAVRCFLHNIPDQEARYRELTAFIQTDDLPETVSFEYQSTGIRVGSRAYPILKMQWVEGTPLLSYVAEHIKRPEQLSQLAEEFFKSTQRLRAAGIAHGDLQHGNILICGTEIRLVDYDGMYVPELAGFAANELGHANYQHPARQMSDFGDYLDNFSAWLIYLSLEMLARAPELAKFHGFDDCLIFKRADLRNPESSPVFAAASFNADPAVRSSAKAIKHFLGMPLVEIPTLADNSKFVASRESRPVSPLNAVLWRLRKWLHDVRRLKVTVVRTNLSEPQPPPEPQPVPAVQPVSAPSSPSWLQDWLPDSSAASAQPSPVAAPNTIALPPTPASQKVPAFVATAALRNVKQALQYSDRKEFFHAHELLRAALHSAGGDMRVRIEILRARAQILVAEAHVLRGTKPVAAAVAYSDAKQALEQMRHLRNGAPNSVDDVMTVRILVELADCLERDGKFEQAVGALNEALRLVRPMPQMQKTALHIERKLNELK